MIVWAISCQSTASQFARPRRPRGLVIVISGPKHTPRNDSPPGRPKVRIAKSSCFGSISTITGCESLT